MRQTIAEILEALSYMTYSRQHPYVHGRSTRLARGAATLRWTDEYVRKQRVRTEW